MPRHSHAPYLPPAPTLGTPGSTRRMTSPPVLVEEDHLAIAFQPMVSVRERSIFAIEGLARAHDPLRGREVSPAVLFRVAEEMELLPDFDRFCRRRAAERFLEHVPPQDDVLLSVNWDARCLAAHEGDPYQFARLVQRLGISPGRLMIEILESSVEDTRALARFAHARRREGFLVAVDDYGTGHSSLERVAMIEPDVIKVDRFLVQGLSTSHPKREACRAVVEMARNVGALVVAEGVEREEDVYAALEVGFDLFQGFYFARPHESYLETKSVALERVSSVADHLSELSRAQIAARRAQRVQLEAAFRSVLEALRSTPADAFGASLDAVLGRIVEVEAAYVLDAKGIQVTDTHTRKARADDHRARAFRPARRGADQSLKEYFLTPSLGAGTYESRPYVSMATGHLCITMSRYFESPSGDTFLLCCDLPAA